MFRSETWRARWLTLEAMAWLVLARLAVALFPFGWWCRQLGPCQGCRTAGELSQIRRLAAHVGRAASRLPAESKCLPQAMALGWMLRRRRLDHAIVLVVRPPGHREDADRLHAWLAAHDEIVLGDLPGPWTIVLEIGSGSPARSD